MPLCPNRDVRGNGASLVVVAAAALTVERADDDGDDSAWCRPRRRLATRVVVVVRRRRRRRRRAHLRSRRDACVAMSDRRARRDASASSGAAKSGALSAHDDDDRRRLGARARGRTSEMRGAMNANAALPARAATRATSRRATTTTTRTRRASMTSRKATTTRTRAVGINDAEKPPEETVAGVELQLGRAAMLGFLGTTVGDVLTRGDGPIEQLGDEFSYVARHVVNPVEVARDALEVAGFYVESVVLIWFLLGGSLLLGFWQGARSPIKTVSGKSAKQRAEAAFGEIEKAYETTVREQKPYELFNGRLAMLGTAFAFVGDVETGGLGPLEQVQLESGIPIIDEEIFALVFLAGVSFNVVATGVTAVRRAYVKGRE